MLKAIGILGFCLVGTGLVSPQPITLAGIAHVAFRVNDLEKTRAFYNHLGFEESFSFSQDGKATVSYVKVNDRQFIELYQRLDDRQATGFQHISFEAGDIESLWKAYLQHGLDMGEPRKAKAGNLLTAAHDPEGRLVEFTQYMPGSLHSADRGKHLGSDRVADHFWRVVMPSSDSAGELAFYTDKLGFAPASADVPGILRLPGESGDEIAFSSSQSSEETQIIFLVSDLTQTANKLRARGLKVSSGSQSVSVTDPDGVIDVFTSRHSDGRDEPQ